MKNSYLGYTTTSTTVMDQPISPAKDEYNGETEKGNSRDDSLSNENETNGDDSVMASENGGAAPQTDQSEHGDCNGDNVDGELKPGHETEAVKVILKFYQPYSRRDGELNKCNRALMRKGGPATQFDI